MFLTKMDDLLSVTNIINSSSDLLQSHMTGVNIRNSSSEQPIVALDRMSGKSYTSL